MLILLHFWLRGLDLLKTLQSAFGYEAAMQNKRTLASSDQKSRLRINNKGHRHSALQSPWHGNKESNLSFYLTVLSFLT